MEQNLGLNELQTCVQRGDGGAARELGRRLKPIIACLVRRALCLPSEGLWLEGLVRAEMSQMSMPVLEEKMVEDRRLVAQIVARICSTLIDRLRFGIGPALGNQDTIEPSRPENTPRNVPALRVLP